MKIYSFCFILLFPFLSCNQSSEFPKASQQTDSLLNLKKTDTGTPKIVLKSTDDGQTWQDISEGLLGNIKEDSIRGNNFFTNEKGLFLKAGNEVYHYTAGATAPFWTKESASEELNSKEPAKSGIFNYKYWGVNLQKSNGTSIWSPIFENYHRPGLRSAFETAGGSIFIGIDRGLYKTTDNGKTWKQVYAGHLIGNLAESDGVLLSTSMKKIIRSTDNGENWVPVIHESGEVWDVKAINGGFAAITTGSGPNDRKLWTSTDGGKTWKPFDAIHNNKNAIDSIWKQGNDGLRRHVSMTSIIQVGENYFCTHRDGIFKSSDKGITWNLLLPSIKDKFYSIFVSGKDIYAIALKPGC
jgi:photosystem II stability/assembly factor-like uncharacterized protein